MHLPPPIENYFAADRGGDTERLLAAFAPDATVQDEGRTYRGHREIASWWRAAKARYDHLIEPVALAEESPVEKIRAIVTGNFPGSPAELTFAFQLLGDRIVRLEIGA